MAARAQQMLLCVSVAVLLVTPCCNAARSLRSTGTRVLPSSTSLLEDDPEVPRNDIDEAVPSSALKKDIEFNQWARSKRKRLQKTTTPPKRIRTLETRLRALVSKRGTHLSCS